MAVTKIHAIKSTVNKAIDYITNPEKTDGTLLVSGYNCEADYAYLDFKMTAELAKEVKGDYTKTGGADNLAYHTIQSFAKYDKITPEEAHELGKKLANEMLEGKHEYVIATHVDKGHIHNHIILNAVSFYDYGKYRTEPYKTARKIRVISDRLCEEKGLHVIREPLGKGKNRTEWEAVKNGTSWKTQIQSAIDSTIAQATDYNNFVELMKKANVEIKEGKHIAFRLEGQQRFVRGKTIGENYTKEQILNRMGERAKTSYKEITINEKLILDETEKAYFTRLPNTKKYIWFDKEQCAWTSAEHKTLHVNISTEQPYNFVDKDGNFLETITGEKIHEYYDNAAKKRKEQPTGEPEQKAGDPEKFSAVKTIKGSITAAKKVPFPLDKKVAYLSRKQQISATKEMAATLVLLRRESIAKVSDFDVRIDSLKEQCQIIKGDIKQLDSKNSQYKEAAKYLVSYNNYLPIKQQYEQQSMFKKRNFYSRYESELLAFDHADKQLEKLGVNTNVDTDKVVELVRQQTEKTTELHSKFKQTENRIDELKKARGIVEGIIKPPQGEQQKDTRRERDER